MQAFCKVCESVQDVDKVEEGSEMLVCLTCGEEFSAPLEGDTEVSAYNNFFIAKILSVEPIAKQKDLKKVLLDIKGDGDIGSAVQVVTNAKYVEVGWNIVVALENAIIPAGASLDDDANAIRVKACAVGGVMSRGMLCDSPMLAWTGGAKGIVQQLSDAYVIGEKPPSSRPRL